MIAVDENLCGIRLPALRGDIVCDVSTVSLVLAALDADLYAGSQYGAARPLEVYFSLSLPLCEPVWRP
jgi:hypothetical protein